MYCSGIARTMTAALGEVTKTLLANAEMHMHVLEYIHLIHK